MVGTDSSFAIAPRLRGRAAFLLGAIAWFLGEMYQWNYVRQEMEFPPPITILYFVVPAVIFGFGVLFVRSFLRRGSVFLASLALPVYWVHQRDNCLQDKSALIVPEPVKHSEK
jgi:hypothetical protein